MYRLEITDRARDDADAAHAWMTENISQAYADKGYQGLFQQIETLTRHPGRCPVARESSRFPEKIQELVYGKARHKHKYRILFEIRGDVVAILFIASQGHLRPILSPSLYASSGTCRKRHRVLSGFRRFATGYAALSPAGAGRQRANATPAAMLACRLPVRRL